MENDTICAISTPIGTGGISIVRMSGNNALHYACQIFSCKNLDRQNVKPRYFYLGNISCAEFDEKCMMVYFQSPHSYTGEDLVEFQCHGGVLVTRKILETLVGVGARLAEGGEFTKRAFINGKLSLDEAEGVIDTINAESESELRASSNLVKGNLHTQIESLQNTITDVLSEINVTFDFPENDDEEITSKSVMQKLTNVQQTLNSIVATSKTGIKLKDGNKVVIVGKPNVGKSSLMNAMLGLDRAIVTDIQGTTRDVLEETYIYKGVRFVLTDTAGLRESSDIVESIGIQKARQSLDSADVVLFVLDSGSTLDDYDMDIIKLLDNKNVIVVLNKVDLKQKIDISTLPFSKVVSCSTTQNKGIDNLKQTIYDMVIDEKVLSQNIIITNMRHANALTKASEFIAKALDDLHNGLDLELVSINLQSAWNALGEITGVNQTEEIISNIFSKFCVGK